MSRRSGIAVLVLVIVAFVGTATSVLGQSSERTRVLQKLGERYQRIADTKNVLFDLDKFRVIQAKFDRRRRLIELAVEPKYYFDEEHPDWAEQKDFRNLSRAEFETLSAELRRIKPLGRRVESVNRIAIVTNMTAWYNEYYRNASLTWGVVEDLRKNDDSYEVRWFRFKYGANASKPRKPAKDFKFTFPAAKSDSNH